LAAPPVGQNPPFKILFVSTASDLRFLSQNIQILKNLYSEISEIVIVTPDPLIPEVRFLKLQYDIKVLSDDDVLTEQIRKIINQCPEGRRGWISQQYIKTKVVYHSDLPVLVVDADTFLMSKVKWFTQRNDQLMFLNTSDFHFEYNSHFEKLFGDPAPLLNFVSHIQLQIPSVVKSIYGKDLDQGWSRWLATGKYKNEGSAVSEYQTYGLYRINANRSQNTFYIPKHLHVFESQLPELFRMKDKDRNLWDLVTVIDKP